MFVYLIDSLFTAFPGSKKARELSRVLSTTVSDENRSGFFPDAHSVVMGRTGKLPLSRSAYSLLSAAEDKNLPLRGGKRHDGPRSLREEDASSHGTPKAHPDVMVAGSLIHPSQRQRIASY